MEKEVDTKALGKIVERGRALLVRFPELGPLREKSALLKRIRVVFVKGHTFEQLETLEARVAECKYELGPLRGEFEAKMAEFRTLRADVQALLEKVDFKEE